MRCEHWPTASGRHRIIIIMIMVMIIFISSTITITITIIIIITNTMITNVLLISSLTARTADTNLTA